MSVNLTLIRVNPTVRVTRANFLLYVTLPPSNLKIFAEFKSVPHE